MIPEFLLEKEHFEYDKIPAGNGFSFIDKTIKGAAAFVSSAHLQWKSSGRAGFLQGLDSRVKVVFMLLYIVLISLSGSVISQLIIAGILFLLCLVSKISIYHLYRKVVVAGFLFGFLIFVPAALNIFTKGEPVLTLVHFSRSHQFWIYTIPEEITVTRAGILVVMRLTLRVINSVSLVLLIVSTTTFERIIKSLSFFKVPQLFLLTLTLSYRFIFILSNAVTETYRALSMRWWNGGTVKEAEAIVAGRIGYLFRKSWERYEIVYQAMIARGFDGRVNFCYFNKPGPADYFFTGAFSFFFFIFLLIF